MISTIIFKTKWYQQKILKPKVTNNNFFKTKCYQQYFLKPPKFLKLNVPTKNFETRWNQLNFLKLNAPTKNFETRWDQLKILKLDETN